MVDVSIGKPIPSEGRQPDELMREVEAWIEAEMRRLDPDAYMKRIMRERLSQLNAGSHACRLDRSPCSRRFAPPRPVRRQEPTAASAGPAARRHGHPRSRSRPSRWTRSCAPGLSPSACQREAVLGDVVVAYEFRRAKRRNIGFIVGPEGLSVSAPRWVPLSEIDAAVREKAGWIVRKLEDAHDAGALEAARIEWKDGATFPYLASR